MTNSPGNSDVSNETIEAFHLMWYHFPQVVLLLKKTRVIVAANKVAEAAGFLPGAKCFQVLKSTKIHPDCKANEALEKGVTKRSVAYLKDINRIRDTYWIPILTEKDLYVHFAVYVKLPSEL